MYLMQLILLASTAVTCVSAMATPQSDINLAARAKVPCDKIEKYSSSYFHTKMCSRPQASKCLFYTRGMGSKARWYAKQNEMTTIWDHWPLSWYDKTKVDTNPLRCIMQDDDDRTAYFGNMSETFAEACTVFATVMTANIDKKLPPGIWKKTEYPALQQGSIYGKVNSIDAISPDGKKIKSPFWARNGVRERGELEDEVEGEDDETEENYEDADQVVDIVSRDPANKPSTPKPAAKPADAKPAAKPATTKPGTKPTDKPDSKAGASTPQSSTCGIGQLGLEADFDATGQYAVLW